MTCIHSRFFLLFKLKAPGNPPLYTGTYTTATQHSGCNVYIIYSRTLRKTFGRIR